MDMVDEKDTAVGRLCMYSSNARRLYCILIGAAVLHLTAFLMRCYAICQS